MIRTRTKPVCKTHFNLTSKQIHQYRRYILNLVNRKWLKQVSKNPTDKQTIRFTENKIHHFVPSINEMGKIVESKPPKKGILKTSL